MKRQLCTLTLSALLASGIVFAQDAGSAPSQQPDPNMQSQGGPDGGGPHGGHHGMMDPEQRLAHMTKRYGLTTDQQSQIKPILQDEQQQMMSMHADTSMSRQDKMAKAQSMHQANDQKIDAVLTDAQRQKFDADQQKMEARRAEHMHGMQGGQPGGQDAPPPPPDGSAPPPPQQ